MSRHKGFFNALFCCFRPNSSSANGSLDGHHNHHHNNRSGRSTEVYCYPGGKSGLGSTGVNNSGSTAGTSGKYLLPLPKASDSNKLCLVIDLDETLVHSSFKPINNADFIVPVEIDGTIHQVYVLKRPFVDEFLQRMGQLYECVLFTASLAKYADPVSDLLDKWSVFNSRLFRESCVFYKGNYVKDLSRLGRDLNKVIIIDNSPASYIFHPDNAVPVASWFDDMSDTELRDLIPFFEKLSRVDNIYSVLRNANPQSNNPSPVNMMMMVTLGQNNDQNSASGDNDPNRIIMSVNNENRNSLNMTSSSSPSPTVANNSPNCNFSNHSHSKSDLMSSTGSSGIMGITSPNPISSVSPPGNIRQLNSPDASVNNPHLESIITSVPRPPADLGSGDHPPYHLQPQSPTHHQNQHPLHPSPHHQQTQQHNPSGSSPVGGHNNQQNHNPSR